MPERLFMNCSICGSKEYLIKLHSNYFCLDCVIHQIKYKLDDNFFPILLNKVIEWEIEYRQMEKDYEESEKEWKEIKEFNKRIKNE